MRRAVTLLTTAALATGLGVAPALAAAPAAPAPVRGPHLVGTPHFAQQNARLTAKGEVAGLQSRRIDVRLVASGVALDHIGRHVQRVRVTASGSENDILVTRNGHAHFVVTTDRARPDRRQDQRGQITDVRFNLATITVLTPERRGPGHVVLQATFKK